MRSVCGLVLAGCALLAAAQPKSDWERDNEGLLRGEDKLVLPPSPKRANLIEFEVGATAALRYLVDAASLSVGEDGVVRYALVARSPSGVENVLYEGIRCATWESKLFATGRQDGSWASRPGEWRPIVGASAGGWQHVLGREFFCPYGKPIRSAEEGIAALRRGGHPVRKERGS